MPGGDGGYREEVPNLILDIIILIYFNKLTTKALRVFSFSFFHAQDIRRSKIFFFPLDNIYIEYIIQILSCVTTNVYTPNNGNNRGIYSLTVPNDTFIDVSK